MLYAALCLLLGLFSIYLPGQPILMVSDLPERGGARPLHRATLSDSVYIFTARDAAGIDYYLNDQAMQGRPLARVTSPPFDLHGGSAVRANPFDTRGLENGEHILSARLDQDKDILVASASFTVANTPDLTTSDAAYGPVRDPQVPVNAVVVEPGEDINRVMAQHPPGSTFLLKAGIYRAQTVQLRPEDSLVGEYGAELNGARLVEEVVREGDVWVLPDQTQQGKVFDKCLPEFPACKYPEQVFLDDAPLEQILDRSELRPGTFFFDYRADKIYLADDPAGKRLEVSVSKQAIEGAPNASVRNLTVTKYAQEGDWVTVRLFPGMTLENTDIVYNSGIGLVLDDNVVARYNRVRYSGRIGVMAVRTVGTRLEHNEIAHNNTFGYDYNWEAGGTKFVRTRNLDVKENYVHDNFGPGLWTDIGNENTLYEDNVVSRNTTNGIFHEISGSAVIRYNQVEANGARGIYVSNSFDTAVYGNVLKGNLTSLWASNVCRSEADSFQLKNVHFFDNMVYQDAHFAAEDEWPAGKAAGFYVVETCRHWDTPFSAWFEEMGNTWHDNIYHLSNFRAEARPPFLWEEGEVQLTDWQQYGLQ